VSTLPNDRSRGQVPDAAAAPGGPVVRRSGPHAISPEVAAAHTRLAAAGVDELLVTLCQEAWRLVGADRSAVGVRDGDDLVALAAHGRTPRWTRVRDTGARLPIAGSVAGHVLATGRPHLVRDTAVDSHGDYPLNVIEEVRSSVAVPLLGPDDVPLAVLSTLSSRPGDLDERSLALLDELTGLLCRDPRLVAAVSAGRTAARAQGEQLYRAVLDALGEGVVVHGESGQVLLHNDAALRILGLTGAQLVGRGTRDERWCMTDLDGRRIPIDDLPANRALRTGQEERDRLVVLRREDGAGDRVLTVTCLPRRDHSGDVVQVVVSFSDVTEQHRLAEQAQEQARRLDAAMHLANMATWETTLGTDDWSFSDLMFSLTGTAPDASVGEAEVRGWLGADTWARLELVWEQVLADHRPRQVSAEVTLPDGSSRTVVIWFDLTCDDDGVPVRQWGVVQDVTERVTALRTLQQNEELFRVTFDRAPIGMLMLDVSGDGRVLRSNETFRRMIGRTAGDDADDPLTLAEWTRPEDLARDLARFEQFVSGQREQDTLEKTYVRSDGSTFEAIVTSAMARDETGRPLHVLAHVMDISERSAHGRELERLALTDGLTGLANRRLMEDRLAQALARRGHDQGVVGLVLLDLDHFKVVNDSLGHATGDALLVEVAARLRRRVRQGTTVARLGGDEFVAVVDDARTAADVEAVATRLLDSLREPFSCGPGPLVVTASLGLAVSDGSGSPSELLREADMALYRAKETGRDRLVRFDADLRTRADNRLATEAMLREALRCGWLRLYLQPVVDLGDGDVVGAEALVRVEHPVDGLVLPGEFVQVAEECGLVSDLDSWVLEQAVALLATAPDTRLAVNVSARTVEAGGLPERVVDLLARAGVDASRLDLELTESCLLTGGSAVADDIRRLRAAGCRVGLDDFGTGYSALSYLQALELDFLKIDRSFISHLGQGERHDAVVQAIIDLAHAHRLEVVAEGVEDAGQWETLQLMGCDRGQGWFFGRPAPA
jgi:diguanylate cyclase (GGDEF)-like protein/PAS domain S-box-containing protein